YEGFTPWAYSIAPFITLRPYEQIRNDVCLHHLPVKLVGNGGGYGYGIMGATHHSLEDIGIMRLLPGMRIYIPFTSEDVEMAVEKMLNDKSPNYLRLNLIAKIKYDIPAFAAWRRIKGGNKGTVIGTGPVLENIFNINDNMLAGLEIWVVSIFPFEELPEALLQNIELTRKVITIEEHYEAGGLGEALAKALINKLSCSVSFNSLCANGYPGGRYGSQQWHQAENNLAGENLEIKLTEYLK
ncbi:MAG: transketolase C-terminal domain-containing protein, partial [Ginsengibacter sp.]